MKVLQEKIEQLYEIFKIYPANPSIHHCDCGCMPEAEGGKILSRPLRELSDDDLSHYRISAMYTWGELEDYKHFLPRIFELFAIDKNSCGLDLDEIINKLKYGRWETWSIEERQSILEMIRVTWVFFINQKKSRIGNFEFEAFGFFLNFQEMMALWKPSIYAIGLQNFVEFYYFNGNELHTVLKKVNIKSDKIDEVFHSFFKREDLQETLEKEFFKVEKQDKEYAEKVSVVLQMIESL